MKEIVTFTRAGINTTADLKLFTAGPQGVLFTAISAVGLTLKAGLARGGTILLPSNPIGAGLGFGDSLLVTGVGDILITFWGSLAETYRLNGTNLEVLVATPILFGMSGLVGDVQVTAGKASLIKAGIYNDRVYRIASGTTGNITW